MLKINKINFSKICLCPKSKLKIINLFSEWSKEVNKDKYRRFQVLDKQAHLNSFRFI